jgi:hypothetical protein
MRIEPPAGRRARRARAGAGLALAAALAACAPALRWLPEPAPPGPPPLVEPPAVDLPAPSGLRARSGELRAVPLAWDPLLRGAVGGYAIERATSREGPFARIGALAGYAAIVYVDRGADPALKAEGARPAGDLGDGATYFYRVRSYAPSGALSAHASPVVEATTAPPPAPPEDLRAYSGEPRRTPLVWSPSPDPHVAGYGVFRGPSAGGPFERIAELEGRFHTSWVDRGLGDLRVFYYRVSARNSAGGEGEPSRAVRAVTKPEPLPPLGLRVAEQWLGGNRLVWEPNVEGDLAGYRLLRLRQGQTRPERVAELGPDRTGADDAEVGAGERVRYSAVAFDRDGLESAAAAFVAVESEDYGATASARAGGVHLTWNPRRGERFERARVLRRDWFGWREIGASGSGEFVDGDARPGRRERYVLVLERGDGSAAPPSAPIEIAVPQR